MWLTEFDPEKDTHSLFIAQGTIHNMNRDGCQTGQ